MVYKDDTVYLYLFAQVSVTMPIIIRRCLPLRRWLPEALHRNSCSAPVRISCSHLSVSFQLKHQQWIFTI